MRFPDFPPDIVARADALLSEKYPDGIVDPRFVEIACEAMMMEQDRCAKIAEEAQQMRERMYDYNPVTINASKAVQAEEIAKAIRGTK